jgi:hypothetical protein
MKLNKRNDDMKNKKAILYIILILLIILVVIFLSVEITKFYLSIGDRDYQKLGLKIEDYDIVYYTVYEEDCLGGNYKVYKIKNYYSDSMDEYKEQLEASNLWSKNKYYEYIMQEFYEIKDDDEIYIDREELYYYNGNDAYAIFDLKNAKLYYFENRLFNNYEDYHESLELDTRDYDSREIYSVRGGPQGDGTDYYVYNFNEEKGKEISATLDKRKNWSKEKLENSILDCFEYNSEIFDIQNGYYYYKKVCRTSDSYKKEHFTDEEATGYEVSVYDCDKNILYYYWTSY